jgi:CxxC motif-containing protein (DUF1111 family)
MLAGAQSASACVAPCDTGVRGGQAGAGGAISGLTANQLAFFNDGRRRFLEVDSVSGGLAGEQGIGLGPRFNLNECGGCHSQPAIGGSSPTTNPEVAMATLDGARNVVPSFITVNGPVREVRFKSDGGVHDLYTITGRTDAGACSISQPDFSNTSNLSYRIPTPTFGAGLIENIRDSTIIDNQFSDVATKNALGIGGHVNREGNAGTITRFGWKAQNKGGEIFAGEAYLVEQGVTSEAFPNERGEPGERPATDDGQRVEPPPACLLNGIPEDSTNFDASTPTSAISDVVGFTMFMQFLAPPAPIRLSKSATVGQGLFGLIGCGMCHTPSLPTGTSSIAALSNQQANLFSDLLVHHMGSTLADGISQGNAGGDEFRTAPLWGAGQRIFFLHDGRTNDLLAAIQAHASSGSEANTVINNFNALGPTGEQAILDFLRSL